LTATAFVILATKGGGEIASSIFSRTEFAAFAVPPFHKFNQQWAFEANTSLETPPFFKKMF
jgi:hypothetical protein